MKGLKKVALASAIAAVSAGAQAELKALDDSAMGELTGQAGLTIDVETKWSIGEFAYHDEGYVILQNISLGGNTNVAGGTSYLDNFRMTIDVAGATSAGETFSYGFSEVIGLAALHVAAFSNPDTNYQAAGARALTGGVNASVDVGTGLQIDDERSYGDGDLVIHFGFTDAWEKGGGLSAYLANAGDDGAGNMTAGMANLAFSAARDIASRAVDFTFNIDVIGIAGSGYTVGSQGVETYANTNAVAAGTVIGTDLVTGLDSTADTTALISGLNVKGYLGPADLHISNNGNGFGNGSGVGDADSKITWGSFFRVTDLDLYIDIAGVQLGDIEIHNTRGDVSSLDGTSSFGFAHSIREIYAVNNAVVDAGSILTGGTGYVDGIALNTEFKGDIDIGHLSFGDTGTSIGEIYLTDVYSDTNWTISAH